MVLLRGWGYQNFWADNIYHWGYIGVIHEDNAKENGNDYNGLYGHDQILFHNKMTSSLKSKVPFAHTIASFRGSMIEVKKQTMNSQKELLAHALNSKTKSVEPQYRLEK